MNQERAKELLAKAGAILEGHFVGTSGNHLSVYVAKDRATRLTSVASELCAGIAELFAAADIDAVVAPAVGGIALSQWTAYHLTRLRPDRPEVLALYSEHEEEVLGDQRQGAEQITATVGKGPTLWLKVGEQLILRKPSFVLKRGFNVDVRGKLVLEVEDVLTTGGSAKRTSTAIVESGGLLVGLGVLANGGNVTAEACGVDRLEALLTVDRQIFTVEDCLARGLCAQGVPINTDYGHGKDFLARQSQQPA